MNHDRLYNNLCQSIVKFCQDMRAEFGELSPAMQLLDWDEHANIFELPETDLIGPSGTGMVDEDGTYEVVFGIGISTLHDQGLFRLRNMMSRLYGRLRPGQQITLYDFETTQPISWIQLVAPTAVVPVGRTEVRPLQFIECKALIDPRAPFVQ